MEFKRLLSKKIVIPSLLIFFVIGVILCKSIPKADLSTPESVEPTLPLQIESIKDSPLKASIQDMSAQETRADDAAIAQQLDRDREEQKQTKYLKTKLEQTNLELEQEKAIAEINKLKMENRGIFKDTVSEGQNDLPEVRVEYIGGDSAKKEAIISIAGTNYQVKEKSHPTDNIQIMAISDSNVTLHFSAPQQLTKIIDYKPE